MIEIRALRPDDSRAGFHSGNIDLDRFFAVYAGQNQFRHHVGATYVAVADGRIAGYATVAAGHVEIERLPLALRKRLPSYPVPILRLGRLAVDLEFRGQGVGKDLLRFVFELALWMAAHVGCVAVVVDAKPEAVAFYESYGFVPLETVEGAAPARLRAQTMVLPIAEIKAAAAG